MKENMKCGETNKHSNHGVSREDGIWRSCFAFPLLYRFLWKGNTFLDDKLPQKRPDVSTEDYSTNVFTASFKPTVALMESM